MSGKATAASRRKAVDYSRPDVVRSSYPPSVSLSRPSYRVCRSASRPLGCVLFGATLGGPMMDYDLANYLLASLPAAEREQTIASLRRANAAEFRRMRETVVRGVLLGADDSRRT